MQKTYGTLSIEKDRVGTWWVLKAVPHVMIKVKAVFGRIDKQQFGTVRLKLTPESCRDMEWFIQRYPLDVPGEAMGIMLAGAQQYRKALEAYERIMLPNHIPREYPLALPLRSYQTQALELYIKRKRLLCADQLGLGKTAIAVGSFTQKAALPALAVVQTHLASQWKRQIHKFLPFAEVHIIKSRKQYPLPAADVYIITYSKLDAWAEVLAKFTKSVVFDEVQEMRHSGTGKYQAGKFIADNCEMRLGLSATPIHNYGGEIFNIMNLISPGELGTDAEFYREWCEWNGKHYLLKDPDVFGTYLRDEFMMVRRTRKDVAKELPPLETIVQSVDFTQKVLDDIKDTATELAHRILQGSFTESGQAAREFDSKLRQVTGISKAPFVAAFVRMLVEDGQPVILSGWHREVYSIWLEHLKDLNPVMFTGSESPAQKEAARAKFMAGETDIIIMSLRSGAGLDGLQERCCTTVHGELDWTPATHEQLDGRVFRDGQTNPVSAYYMVADGGSDPDVAAVLGLKTSQITGLLEPGGGGLKKMQSDGGARVRRMAENYLKRKREDKT